MASDNYASFIATSLVDVHKEKPNLLFFGENINQGSCISGLAKGLSSIQTFNVVNVGNCELTHVGIGFGTLIDGGSSVLIVKQLDFLLLALDQVVNTFNWIRAYIPVSSQGSFTIYSLICDQGFQGPQSSFNNASDFASIANIDVHCLNTTHEITDIVSHKFVSPGFRIVCLSQKYLGCPPLTLNLISKSNDLSIYHYLAGIKLTILCYNFSLRIGLDLARELSHHNISCDLFHVNYIPSSEIDLLLDSTCKTNKVILIDDSKSVSPLGNVHLAKLHSRNLMLKSYSLVRGSLPNHEYTVHDDEFSFDLDLVLKFINSE